MRSLWTLLPCFLCSLVCACQPPPRAVDEDLLSPLLKHEAQRQALCARGRVNAITELFCGDEPPAISSLADLQRALGLPLTSEEHAGFSLLAHSSALAGRLVSSLNPQSVIVALPEPMPFKPGWHRDDGNIVALAFARGEPFVEMAVTPPGGELTLYLLRYEQPCDDEPGGCDLTARFSERTESGWLRWSLYDDEDLKNTVLDCLHCHQPDGPGTPRIYRIQELQTPWTHWEASFLRGGNVLLEQTVRALGTDGTVAGIPGELVRLSDPVVVEDLLRFAGSEQTNVFDAPAIEREVMESNPAQPEDNRVPGRSVTWEAIYDVAVRGDAIPPPYHDVQVTDPDKLEEMTRALIDFRTGASPLMPDLREVFAEEALAGMSHRPKPGLSGEEILVHACAQCHNERLDQSLSRARFDPKRLDDLSEADRELAIERLLLPVEDRLHMPPHLFRDLSPEELDKAVAALRWR